VRSLSGEARANILKELLITFHENGISDVRSITFDGAATNSAMVSYLGANIKRIDEDCFFEHPVTQEPVYVVPDACHALKLVRNTFAGCTIYDRENNVRWSHLLNLVEIQEREELYLATKIRRRHVCFQNEKMKVKLAAQVLSESVAKALLYMEKRFPNQFIGASSTSIFCQTFNDCFDILNSRRQCGKNVFQKAITRENIVELQKKYLILLSTLNLFAY